MVRKQLLGLSPVCNLSGAYLIEAQKEELVQEVVSLRVEIKTIKEEIKECEKHPEGHNECLQLPGLDAQLAAVQAQLAAVMGEELLLMRQLQGAMPALCATHELCLLLLCVPHMSCV